MSMPHPETFQLVPVSRDWILSLVKDAERRFLRMTSLDISRIIGNLDSLRMFSILVASGALLYFWRIRVSHQSSLADGVRKPPVVSYWIPWLGSALQIQRDPDSLFRRAR